MNLLFLANFLVSLGISIFLFWNFWKRHRIIELRKPFNFLFMIGLLYLLLSTFSFLWFLNIFEYNQSDFLIIKSLMILLQTFFLFNLIYLFRKQKKIFYFMFFYLGILSSGLIGVSISSLLIIFSFIITLLIFILLIYLPGFEEISRAGIFYASVSLILQIVSLIANKFYFTGGFITNILFLGFIILFVLKIENFPIELFEKNIKNKKRHYFLDFLRYFVFIIILTNFVFIGTITVHEVGHLLTSRAFDCGFDRIVYDVGLPHTEILCGGSFDSFVKVVLGGMILPLGLALLLFFAGGTFIKEVSLLIVGFDLIISYKDFTDLGLSGNLGIFFSIIGIIIIFLSIGLLAKSRTTEDEILYFA